MTFRAFSSAVPTIEILAPSDVANSLFYIKLVQMSEERKRVHGDIQESRVDLPKLVASEYARLLLQRKNDCNRQGQRLVTSTQSWSAFQSQRRTLHYTRDIDTVERILRGQDLNGTECGEDVCIVIGMGSKSTYAR